MVRYKLSPQKPPGLRLLFSHTRIQRSPDSSTIELPSVLAESGYLSLIVHFVFDPLNTITTLYEGLYSMYDHHVLYKSMDQPGKVANPALGQLNREKFIFPVPVCA